MKRRSVKYIVAPLLLSLSCSRHAKVSDPLPADQVVAVIQQSFQNADSSTREAVQKIVDEAQRHDVSAAYLDLKELSAEAHITMDQRIAAIRAANTIGQQLSQAAQNGDTQAADAVSHYSSGH